MITPAQHRAKAQEEFEACYRALLESADRLRNAVLAEASCPRSHPRTARIMEIVAARYGMSLMDLVSPRRTKDLIWPRHVAMYLCARLTTLSTSTIGAAFGRDHSTVIHTLKSVQDRIDTDDRSHAEIAALRSACVAALNKSAA